ncbi:MAG: GNAT family N-acetyltransferase [Reyranella sp.]|nr:GNAT family N-acetyltransferase [Reyranella sp.]
MTSIELHTARPEDRDFLQALSPRLSGVPGPAWHDLAAMEGFQSRYMAATFAPAALDGSSTLIAWSTDGRRLGYVHMRPGKDGVTEEPCGYVSLLAVDKDAEGSGVATQLMAAAEDWARARSYRFLSLDVFADNRRAVDFYRRGGFEAETVRMVKPL